MSPVMRLPWRHELRAALLGVLGVMLLAGCGSSAPVVPPVFVDTVPPLQRMAAIEAVSGVEDDELSVQPLRDLQVEDLRQLAAQARAAGDLAAAMTHLDQALALVNDDPGVRQERAELALLGAEPALAEQHARAALELGSRTGPLCRRHWATIWQSRLARNEQINADSARAQIDGCTVPPIQRY